MAIYTNEDLIKMIRSAGLRATEHRVAVLSVISRAKEPITVYDLLLELRKKYDIDQATVYRNIISLFDASLIRRLDFNHGHAHYEFFSKKSSMQLICNNCESVEKIKGVDVEDYTKKIIKKSLKFKNMIPQTIQIYGLCKKCS
jgi:Fe2+ or Zn2+ uptake regulation protein